MLKKIKTNLLGIFLIILSETVWAESNRPVFKQILCTVKVNKNNPQELSIELAETVHKRSYGLMNREDLRSNSGMLFVWKDRQIRNFWMKTVKKKHPVEFICAKCVIVWYYYVSICSLSCF